MIQGRLQPRACFLSKGKLRGLRRFWGSQKRNRGFGNFSYQLQLETKLGAYKNIYLKEQGNLVDHGYNLVVDHGHWPTSWYVSQVPCPVLSVFPSPGPKYLPR